MKRVRIDGSIFYVDEKDVEELEAVESAINSFPPYNPRESVDKWLDYADFRHMRPNVFLDVVESACIRFVGERRIDFSSFMHELCKTRFGEYQGEKFASAFDSLISAFTPY